MDNTEFEQEKFIESYKREIQNFEIPARRQITVLDALIIAHLMNNLNNIHTGITIDYIEALIEVLYSEIV